MGHSHAATGNLAEHLVIIQLRWLGALQSEPIRRGNDQRLVRDRLWFGVGAWLGPAPCLTHLAELFRDAEHHVP